MTNDEPTRATAGTGGAGSSTAGTPNHLAAVERLATAIRRHRDAANVSHSQLASMLGYSRQYVAATERASKGLPSAELVGAIDVALHAAGELVRLHEEADREKQSRRGYSAQALAHFAGRADDLSEPGRAEHTRSDDSSTFPVSMYAIEDEIVKSGDDAARFVRKAGVTANSALIEQFDAEIQVLSNRYLTHAPYTLFRPLAELRKEVFDVLDRHPRPEYIRDLYRIAGWVSGLLAHASNDLGHADAADSHARTAWICCDLSGDTQVAAYVRWIQSCIAFWRGDFRAASTVAQTAMESATDEDGRLRLASQAARAKAALGDEPGVATCLDVARDLRDNIAMSAVSDTLSAFHFGSGKAAYYASEAWLSLGGEANSRRAVTEAENSLAHFAAANSRRGVSAASAELVAAATLDLVSALLTVGNIDAAADKFAPIMRLPSVNRTVPITGRVRDIHALLAAPGLLDQTDARSMREQAEIFRAFPATASKLPAIDVRDEEL